jgi:hypothetical protein
LAESLFYYTLPWRDYKQIQIQGDGTAQ